MIIGGAGFIGAHLTHLLKSSGIQVSVFDREAPRRPDNHDPNVRYINGDLGDNVALGSAMTSIEVVFHLAWSGIHAVSNQDVSAHASLNLIPTLKLFDACSRARIKRLVFLSSGGAVYGNTMAPRIAEDHPTRPVSAYGVTKLAAEEYLEFYGRLNGLDYVILRPSVPYGEWQNLQRGQGAVGVFLDCAMRHKPITIWGDGTSVRDYFYVGDLAQACLLAANSDVARGIYNIGGGEPVTLNQLVEIISDVTRGHLQVLHEAARRFDPRNVVLDITRAKRDLSWEPRITLRDGIDRTWQWIVSQSEIPHS